MDVETTGNIVADGVLAGGRIVVVVGGGLWLSSQKRLLLVVVVVDIPEVVAGSKVAREFKQVDGVRIPCVEKQICWSVLKINGGKALKTTEATMKGIVESTIGASFATEAHEQSSSKKQKPPPARMMDRKSWLR